jgi:hypothetical protein
VQNVKSTVLIFTHQGSIAHDVGKHDGSQLARLGHNSEFQQKVTLFRPAVTSFYMKAIQINLITPVHGSK